MSKKEERHRAAYVAAVQALSPLTRAVFLLHRIDDLPYREIVERLSIDEPVVIACFARALISIARSIECGQPTGPEPPLIVDAEAFLRTEHSADRIRRPLLRLLPPPKQEATEVNHRAHWPASLAQWFGFACSPTEERHTKSLTTDFDEWLRKRQGPPKPDESWSARRAVV